MEVELVHRLLGWRRAPQVVDTLLPDVLAATRGPATLANLGALGGSSELSCEGPV